MEAPQDKATLARSAAITRLIDDVRAAYAAGKEVDEQAILAAHSELMPELSAELEKLRRVRAARAAADTVSQSQQDSPDWQRPAIQAPGYSILRELSRGGQAVVYLAMQLSTGREVALKVMREGPLADDRALARFKREVQALASLNHPNIVTIFDTGRAADGSHFIAMKYIPGLTLDDYMKHRLKKDSSDPSRLLRLFLKICAAVNVAHARGIVHRDLKPTNIRIDERGEPHVLDFGLARMPLDKLGGEQTISITGEFLGSLPWCSPEQAEGDPEKIDCRTDVYSLGVILYQIVTGGRFPYEVVGNIRDVLNNVLTAEPTPPSKVAAVFLARQSPEQRRPVKNHLPAVNEAIEKVVLKALAKKREDRYQSAGELGRDIARYLSGAQTAAHQTEIAGNSQRPIVLAAVAIIIMAIGWPFVHQFVAGPKSPASVAVPVAAIPTTRPLIASTQPIPRNPPPPIPEMADIQSQVVTAPTTKDGIPSDAAEYLGHHYKMYFQQTDWNAAARQCRDMGGHLACAGTSFEQDFLQQLKGDQTTAWVGGSADDAGHWTWTAGQPIQLDRIAADGNTAGYNCLFMMRGGKLAARPESGRLQGASVPAVQGFICEWDK